MNAYFKKRAIKNRSGSIEEQSGVQTESYSQMPLPESNPPHDFGSLQKIS